MSNEKGIQMKYFLRAIKNLKSNQVRTAVLLEPDLNPNPYRILSGEKVLWSKEITEEDAILLCGKEAILKEQE